MKRALIFPLITVIILTLVSCSSSQTRNQETVINFYYCPNPLILHEDATVVVPENRVLTGGEPSLDDFLRLYFSGPIRKDLTTPFPDGLYAESIVLDDTRVNITLSSVFSQLQNIDLTVACACLGKTVMEYTSAEYVYISFINSATGNQHTITVGPDSYLLTDNSYPTVNEEND